MMRKFPKLLAVVLAIAIIICPAMCLTSMAETPANDYTVSYADDVVTVKVDAANGFLVALLRLDVEGFDVNEAGIAVTTTEGVEFGANPDFDADAGVLSLLLAAKDAANINVVTSATVTIPVTKTATDDNYGIKLTTIQAADAGSVVDGVLVAEDFIDFPYVADAEDGTIVDAPEEKVEAIKPCTHENTTENTTASTCTVPGSVTVTCDDCGATISSDPLPLADHVAGKYEFDENYHWNVCTYGCSEKLNNAEHVFDNDADADCICGFTREVAPEEIPSLSTVFPMYVEVIPGTFEYRTGIAFTQAGKESLNITNFITEYYGNLEAIGFIQTIDGTDPTIDNGLSSFNQEVGPTSKFRTQGVNLGKYINYYGMNFDQFSYTYKAVGYVRYTDANGETQYVYTDVLTCAPFVDAMTEQAESNALTAKILKAYNDYKGGAFDSIKADVATATNSFLPFSISYDLSNFEVRATIDFKAATAHNVTFINYVEENYGPLTGFGFAQSVDGSTPTTDSNLSSLEQAVSATSPMRTRGVNWNKYINYYGMNVNQLSTQYNVTFYAHYTDEAGVAQTVILENLGFKVIDVLRTIEGNEALTNLIEVYDAVS